jgi:ATP-dependent RNA helicase DeaD
VVVDSLSTEFDVVEIAMAAVRLAHVAAGGEREEPDIPVMSLPSRKPKGAVKGPREKPRGKPRKKPREQAEWDVARLYIEAGRRDGVRPSDLVGAIVNETGLTPRAIGAIEISESHSVVEVPEEILDDLVGVLRKVRFKGKKVTVRRAE